MSGSDSSSNPHRKVYSDRVQGAFDRLYSPKPKGVSNETVSDSNDNTTDNSDSSTQGADIKQCRNRHCHIKVKPEDIIGGLCPSCHDKLQEYRMDLVDELETYRELKGE